MGDTLATDTTLAPRVFIATTGGPSEICQISALPAGARSSYVSTTQSFRQLHMSKDYDEFVRNVLQQAVSDPGPFGLRLDSDLDYGASWEVPVLVRHLLDKAGAGRAVWATGRLDADLRPVPSDDYEILTKIEQSRALLQSLAPDVVAVMPPPTTAQERAAITAELDALGIEHHFPASFDEVRLALGLEKPRALPPALVPRPHPGRRIAAWALGGVVCLAVAGFVAAQRGILPNRSIAKTPEHVAPSGPTLGIDGLYAEEQGQCEELIMAGAPLRAVPAQPSQDGAALSLKVQPTLCALRFSNLSGGVLQLALGRAITDLGVLGSDQYATGVEMPANTQFNLVLPTPPPPMAVTIGAAGAQLTFILE